MDYSFRDRFLGFASLVRSNLEHYFLAVWGIGLRLDPDYPVDPRFMGRLIVDAVLEYRAYGLFALWCPFLAMVLPESFLLFLAVWWAVLAWKRTSFYKTRFAFWTQAFEETPNKMRTRIRYAEELMREIERLDKAGFPFAGPEIQKLVVRAHEIQNLIIQGKKYAAGPTGKN